MNHQSVGAIIESRGKYLLIDRQKFPFGYAGIAGHIKREETPRKALAREIKEESNLKLKKAKLLIHEFVEWNICSKGIRGHDWYVYKCECQGKAVRNPKEAKTLGWYDVKEVKSLKLEKVWHYWFKKLKII